MSDVQPETPAVKASGESVGPEAVKPTAAPTEAASAPASAEPTAPVSKDDVEATPGENEPVDLNKKPGDAPFIIKNRVSNPVAEQAKKSNLLSKVKDWKKDIQYRLKDWWSEPSGKRWVVGVVLGTLVFGVAGAAIMIVLANRKSIKNSITNLVKNKLGWVSEKEKEKLGVTSPVASRETPKSNALNTDEQKDDISDRRPKFDKYETEDAKKERLRLEEQETGPLPDHEVSVPAQRPAVNWTLDSVDDEDEEEVELEDLPRNQNSGYVATGDNTGPQNTSVAIEDVVPARVYSSKRPSLEELLKDKDEVEGPTTTPPRSGLKNG